MYTNQPQSNTGEQIQAEDNESIERKDIALLEKIQISFELDHFNIFEQANNYILTNCLNLRKLTLE